jgi:superfamily I DNA and/or RNA helicase
MRHYYLNLPKENSLAFDTNIKVSDAIFFNARASFEPFEAYIQNVIAVLENKEAIQARWKKVNPKNAAQLSINGRLYEIPKKTVIQVSINEKGCYRIIPKEEDIPDFNEKLKYKIGSETGEISVSQEDFQKKIIRLPAETEKFDRVIWGWITDLKLEPVWISFKRYETLENGNSEKYSIISVNNGTLTIEGELSAGEKEKLFYKGKEIFYSVNQKQGASIQQGVTIIDDKYRRVIFSEDKIDGFEEIKKFESFITGHTLCLEDGSVLDAERDGRNLMLNNDDYGKTVTANNIKFKVEKLQQNNKEAFRIRLEEIDKSDKYDDILTQSPLRHFFDDAISVEDEDKNQYSVIDGRESEYTLILKNNKENNINFPKGDILKVKVNTYPLKKQLEAVSTLKNMPSAYHSPLIKLFEDRNKVRWGNPDNQPVNEWYVITETNRSGYEEQQDFVKKALNTRDFAILEGPPGSGKTTVILELICQLAKRKQRVLLCGSTHVAIDNILERLKEKMKGSDKTFLEEFHILPVRIGDERRINEDIREFQINNIIEENDNFGDLILDAANLVCGTTIGILQHPKFRKREGRLVKDYGKYKYLSDTPIIPEFDCLIIDESSKTTFQEFLVPALYAKKWILAGDVMQLSPYTETEEIVSSIANIKIDGKPLSKNLQYAVFYLQKIKECTRYGGNRFVLPVSSEISKEIYAELTCKEGRINDFMNKIILFITKNTLQGDNPNILVRNFDNMNFLEITAADIIFADENILSDFLPYISEQHAVLRSELWKSSGHAFIHNVYQNSHHFLYNEKGKEFNNSFDIVERINSFFKDKNWAEEVAWRIDREHQVMLINKTKKRYTNQIEELLPKSMDSEKAEEAVNSVAMMAFPSILESLVQGVKGRKTKKGVESTISEGFISNTNFDYLGKRKTTLVYQHRMHPEISKFPREQYYKSQGALEDLKLPLPIEKLREWNYRRYSSRSVWVNVDGETYRNCNVGEANILMNHLKGFIQYAADKAQSEKKEWTVACLTFYRKQERHICERLQALCKRENGIHNFVYRENGVSINIKLYTVDKFQGHEADVVFLSMVQTKRVGFMDNPNRLNVAVTRAKFQLVIIGKRDFFLDQQFSDDLKELAFKTPVYKDEKK